MEPEQWTEVRALFEEALELPQAAREDFVRSRTEQRARLRDEVLELLRHSDTAPGFLAAPTPPGPGMGARAWQPSPGESVGPYRVERLLGQGGMGGVYLARQERPPRPVALKVMHQGLGGESARQRFESEAEILGRLRHARIASIFEAGVHEDEQGGEVPYFVMEYVEGARDLIRFAREERLDTQQRIELFRGVCEAVHHAHQKGVVHRDLKPGNVLVDTAGNVKVIDYGVARLTDEHGERTHVTQDGFMVGTPQYMSPEQLSGQADAVDTRSDIYSLGVLLYELLSGELPYDAGQGSLAQLVADVCEREPPPPSSRAGHLSRELDWVVLAALAKEPERRYSSAAALSEDLARFLAAEPVVAHPPTRRYRVSKFVARNRALVAAGSLLVLSLLAGITSTVLALMDAQEARAAEVEQGLKTLVALERRTQVMEILEDLVQGVLATEDGREVTMFTLLERKRGTVQEELAQDPELRAEVLNFFTQTYYALGLTEDAAELARDTLDALEETGDTESKMARDIRRRLANLMSFQGRTEEAQALLDQAAASPEADLRTQLFEGQARAVLLSNQGDFEAAVELFQDLIALADEGLPAEDPILPTFMGELAELLALTKRYDEAIEVGREGLDLAEREHGEDSVRAAILAMRLGVVLRMAKQSVEAEEHLARSMDLFHDHFGPGHPNTLQAAEGLVRALADLGRTDQAEGLAQDSLAACLEEHDERMSMSEVRLLHALAYCLAASGKREERIEVLEGAIERMRGTELANSQVGGELLRLHALLVPAAAGE